MSFDPCFIHIITQWVFNKFDICSSTLKDTGVPVVLVQFLSRSCLIVACETTAAAQNVHICMQIVINEIFGLRVLFSYGLLNDPSH
jgi:hypothetical protein